MASSSVGPASLFLGLALLLSLLGSGVARSFAPVEPTCKFLTMSKNVDALPNRNDSRSAPAGTHLIHTSKTVGVVEVGDGGLLTVRQQKRRKEKNTKEAEKSSQKKRKERDEKDRADMPSRHKHIVTYHAFGKYMHAHSVAAGRFADKRRKALTIRKLKKFGVHCRTPSQPQGTRRLCT